MNRLFTAALTAALGFACVTAAEAASVEIKNRSSWDLHQLYLSPVGDSEWGPDQLGEYVIESGETFTLNQIRCDRYDIQLVDEDGDVCVIGDVKLCDDKVWDITDKHLLGCQAETE